MKSKLFTVLLVLTFVGLLAACNAEPEVIYETVTEQVEVTRIVEVEGEPVVETVYEEVEVTRVVEMEEEMAEATPLPETAPGDYANAGRHETVFFDASVTHADPANFNPWIVDNLRDVGVQQGMIEPLFILNYETGELDPYLAESMESNETFDVWTLKLRDGIKWSDGEAFNADDVVFTVDMFKANTPDMGPDVATWTESAEKIDDLTVQFNLTAPNPRYQLDVWSVKIWGDRNSIIPEHIWKDYLDAPMEFTFYDPDQGWPVFTGPYLISSFTDNEWVYVRDDNWWGVEAGFNDLPTPKRLVWTHYGTEETRAAAAVNNELDILANTTKGAYEAIVARNANFTTWTGDELPYAWQDPCPRYLQINNQHPIWSDPLLRKAVNLAIDRTQIVAVAYEGTSYPSKSHFVQYGAMEPYISALEDAGLTVSDQPDIEGAKALIEQAGWALNDAGWYEKDGEVLTLEILTIEEFQEIRRIGDVVAEQLRKIGIDSQARVMGFLPLLTAMAEPDAQGTIWFLCGGVNEPYVTLNTFHGGADAENSGGDLWSGPNWEAYRAAVEELEGFAPGDPASIPITVEAYSYLMEDMPNIPLTQASQLLPMNTTYWVGWPTTANPYTNPGHWTQNAHLTIHNLQPAQ